MNNIDKYLKKVAKDTKDPELKDGLERMLDDDSGDNPWMPKGNSTFKESSKKFRKIEDGADKT